MADIISGTAAAVVAKNQRVRAKLRKEGDSAYGNAFDAHNDNYEKTEGEDELRSLAELEVSLLSLGFLKKNTV